MQSAKQVESTCQACNEPDDEQMVACDRCETWWHFACVGVGESISAKDFLCPKCNPPTETTLVTPNNTEETPRIVPPRIAASVANSAATGSSRRRSQLRLKKLEEEKVLMERQLELERKEKENEIEKKKLELEKKFNEAKFQVLEQELEEDEDDRRTRKSQQSSRSKVKQWIGSQHLGDTGAMDPVTQEKELNQIPSPQDAMEGTSTQQQPANERTPINRDQSYQITLAQSSAIKQPVNSPTKPSARNAFPSVQRTDGPMRPLDPINPNGQRQTQARSSTVPPPLPNPPAVDNRYSYAPPEDISNVPLGIPHSAYVGPAPHQLAARQVMPKELPAFSGSPEDWPLFISAYKNSTQACGYTNAENLVRLQRCLRGHALEAVRSRLLLPASVPMVIATLRTLYGRPELLIHTLLRKVKEVAAPKSEKLETLIAFGMAVQNLTDHLIACNHEAHLNNPTLLFELVEKLPANHKLEWALYKRQFQRVDLQTFAVYMGNLVAAATEVTLYVDGKQNSSSKTERMKDRSFHNSHDVNTTAEAMKAHGHLDTGREIPKGCHVCKDLNHKVRDCDTFRQLSVENRWKTVQRLQLCRICLYSHGKRPCKSKRICEVDGCTLRHNPLLHSITEASGQPSTSGTCVNNHLHHGQISLFRVVPVTLFGKTRSLNTFAFLDDGSSVTLLEKSVADYLNLDGESDTLCLTWTSNVTRVEPESKRVNVDISGASLSRKYKIAHARTVQKLNLPRQTLDYSNLASAHPHLKQLPMADYKDAIPKILIGCDNAYLGAALKIREGGPNVTIASKTRLGWSIHGPLGSNEAVAEYSFHICECSPDDDDLHELVKQHFAIESLGVSLEQCPESADNQRAMRILKTTKKRVGQHFETGLIWKYDSFEFPDSYLMAVRRLQCLERRMYADPVIGTSVKNQMLEYEQKGYIHLATEQELREADPRRTWYLPLGVTINPKKPGKIRIFCDAAAKVNGICLNTMLLKGPDLLVSLPAVLFGFRERKVAICADVREMFYQIFIKEEDRHA
ncbi:uncharacterized protein LOC129775721 [Toxorhynchites rutilus septentrionalis]|uniref:uncharacterized protein LOC129775721 n=1 Tax=Toxorhynchites rutilus septentrionalis TaxID=329112 RepID=UPI002478CF00|nr:uncharacterized protein LOC129775721 [Toxorhynchites rutilus septentrionalis]